MEVEFTQRPPKLQEGMLKSPREYNRPKGDAISIKHLNADVLTRSFPATCRHRPERLQENKSSGITQCFGRFRLDILPS